MRNTFTKKLGFFLQWSPVGALLGVIIYLVAQQIGYWLTFGAIGIVFLITALISLGIMMQKD